MLNKKEVNNLIMYLKHEVSFKEEYLSMDKPNQKLVMYYGKQLEIIKPIINKLEDSLFNGDDITPNQ